MEDAIHDADVLLGGFQQHAGCSVTEQGACRTVVIVHHARHLLGRHDDDLLVNTRTDIGRSLIQSHKESGACGLDVIGIAFLLNADAMSDDRCRRGESVIGIGCRTDEQVDVITVSTCFLKQLVHCLNAHPRRAHGLLENAAFLHADTCGDPLVIGIDHLREHLVIQHVVRQVGCNACNFCVQHMLESVSCIVNGL